MARPKTTKTHRTAPERIRDWVIDQFNPAHVDMVTQDLIDVATGNREGNSFEKKALARIFPDWTPATK